MDEFKKLFPFKYKIMNNGTKHSEELFVPVTYEMLRYCVDHNKNNRKVNKKHSNMICEQVMAGKFIDDGNSLTFDKEGNLIDGGHRANGIKQAFEKGFKGIIYLRFIQVFDDRAIKTRHSGKPDTAGDYIKMIFKDLSGNGPTGLYGVMSQWKNLIEAGKYVNRKRNTPLALDDLYTNPESFKHIDWISKFNDNYSSAYDLYPTVTAVILMQLHVINEKLADQIAEEYYNNNHINGQNETLRNFQSFCANKKRKSHKRKETATGSGAEMKYACQIVEAFNAIQHGEIIEEFSDRMPRKGTKKYENKTKLEDISGKFEEFRRNLFEKNIITLTK